MIYKRVNAVNESCKSYKHLDDNNHPLGLSEKEYKTIVISYLEEMMYRLITTGKPIKFPRGLGALQAVKFKWTVDPIDFGGMKKAEREGKVVEKSYKLKNRSTDGYWTRMHWHKRSSADGMLRVRCTFKHATNYCFRLTRPNLRPNSYNKNNPRVSLYPFFRDKGFQLYQELSTKK